MIEPDKYSLDNISIWPWCEIEDLHGNIKIKIPTDSFIEFLECLDYRTAIINDDYRIVRVQSNIVTVVKNNWDITNVVSEWLDKLKQLFSIKPITFLIEPIKVT